MFNSSYTSHNVEMARPMSDDPLLGAEINEEETTMTSNSPPNDVLQQIRSCINQLEAMGISGGATTEQAENAETAPISTDFLRHILSTMATVGGKLDNSEDRFVDAETQVIASDLAAVFTPFPRLPKEIQLLIWKEAANQPRLVAARLIGEKGDLDYEQVMVSAGPLCPLLSACKDARMAALAKLVRLDDPQYSRPALYLNPEIDTLWIKNYTYTRAHEGTWSEDLWKGAGKIADIAIPFETWAEIFMWYTRDYDEREGSDTTRLTNILRCRFDLEVQNVTLIVAGEDLHEASEGLARRCFEQFFLEQ